MLDPYMQDPPPVHPPDDERRFGQLVATCKIFIGYLQIIYVVKSVPGLDFAPAFDTILSIAMASLFSVFSAKDTVITTTLTPHVPPIL